MAKSISQSYSKINIVRQIKCEPKARARQNIFSYFFPNMGYIFIAGVIVIIEKRRGNAGRGN
jgi:hypothetical protein